MRSNFLLALSNPLVPLSKLGKNVPHGIKGEGMLELGWEKGIDVGRMGWLIGVVGGLEVVSPRAPVHPETPGSGYARTRIDSTRIGLIVSSRLVLSLVVGRRSS